MVLPADSTAEAIQDVVYEIGRRPPFLDEKKKAKDGKPGVSLDWFNMLYQVLLGQEKGPRFGRGAVHIDANLHVPALLCRCTFA